MAVKPIVLPITYKSDPRGLREAESQLQSFAGGIGKIAGVATAAVGLIGAVSVKAFADFDAAMNQSLAIMGDVSDTMSKDMADAAREVAKTTTFSAQQAAESYFFLASAGLNAEQSIGALPLVSKFAQAGMFDMALATDLLTDAQSALGLTSDDTATNMENMARVSDVLVKANTLANASVEQFSTALTTKAGASLKLLGKDVEEGVAVLAALADQGVKAENAGNNLSMALRDLTTKGIQNKEEFEKLGIAVFDSEGEMRNMADIIYDLEKALAGTSDETQKATLLQLGFSDRSLGVIQALLGSSDAIREYERQLREAGGTTEEVAEKQLETFSAQLGLLRDEVIDVGIGIGESLTPMLIDLVDDLKPVVRQIGDALVPAFQSMMPVLALLIGALPQLITVITPLIPTMFNIAQLVFEVAAVLLPSFVAILNVLLPIIQGFTEFLTANSEVVAMLIVGITAATVAVKAWNFAVIAGQLAVRLFNKAILANPLGALLTALVAVISGLVFFFTQTETGRKAWAVFVEFVTKTATAIGEWFMYVFGEWLPGLWDGFVNYLADGWQNFKDGFFGALKAIGNFFKAMINGYISMWENFVNFFISGINNIIRGINQLKITIPSIAGKPGMTVGFNLPTIPTLKLPRLEDGGIVRAQPGGIIANIGEGRYDEAVVPLKPGAKMGATYNITVNAGLGANGGRIGEEIVREIKRYERLSGPVFVSA